MIAAILYIPVIYLLLGFLFAVVFVSLGCHKIDPAAIGAGIGFRLLILPASTVFWPLLLKKWMLARNPPGSKL